MAAKATTRFLLTWSLLLIAFSGTISEIDHLHPINHTSLFDPLALCQHVTKYAKMCEEAATKVSNCTSPETLVEANVAVAIEQAHKALTDLTTLMQGKNQAYEEMMASAFKSCQDNYNSTLDALQQSQNLLKTSGSHDDLITQLSAARTFVTNCWDALNEMAEMTYPIETVHISLDHHVTNCLDLGGQLLR